MADRQGTWGEVVEDVVIRDATGEAWRIAVIDADGYYRAKNIRGELLTISPKDENAGVTIVSHDDEDAAIMLLRDTLGARIMAAKDRESPVWVVEPWPEQVSGKLEDYRMHLFEFHGIYARDIKTYPKLKAAHDAAHDRAPTGRAMTAHRHPEV